MSLFRPGKVSYVDLGVSLSNYEGVTGEVHRFLHTGSQFVLAEYDSSTETTELNYWDSDGGEAVSRLMENTRILDLVYDAADERYYVLRWNESPGYTGSAALEWGGDTVFYDDFSRGSIYDTGKPLTSLWYISAPRWGIYSSHEQTPSEETIVADTVSWSLFSRNEATERLEYTSSVGRGTLSTTAAITGAFQAWGTFYMTKYLGAGSVFSMRLVDRSYVLGSTDGNNLVAQASFRGSYNAADFPTASGTWESASVYLYNDSTGGAWSITNLRLRERELDDVNYALSYGSYVYFVVTFYQYSAADDTNYFRVETSGGTPLGYGVISNTKKAFDFVDGPLGFTLAADPSGDVGNIAGTGIQIYVRIDNTVEAGAATLLTASGTSGFKMGVGVVGTDATTRRDIDGEDPTETWQSINTYMLYPSAARPMGVELYGDCSGAPGSPDLSIDNFEMTSSGTVAWPSIPSLRMETYDATGAINPITDLTDEFGAAIGVFDVINLSSSGIGGYINFKANGGFASITTDQLTEAGGGSVYVALKRYQSDVPRVLRYRKEDFPLGGLETGANALAVYSGTLQFSPLYKYNTLFYPGHTNTELAYATENPADMGRGIFIHTLDGTLLSGTNPRKVAWAQSSDYLAWNITDTTALYGVTLTGTEAGSVKLYNMSPTTAAFCSVASDTRMLAAGSAATSLVRAQVMNIYGEPLSGKTVGFTVTLGDGALSPASALTNASGEAFSTYTVGTSVNTSTITAAVSI